MECEQAVLASEDFRAALKKHYGITDTSLVMVDIWSAGNHATGGTQFFIGRPDDPLAKLVARDRI